MTLATQPAASSLNIKAEGLRLSCHTLLLILLQLHRLAARDIHRRSVLDFGGFKADASLEVRQRLYNSDNATHRFSYTRSAAPEHPPGRMLRRRRSRPAATNSVASVLLDSGTAVQVSELPLTEKLPWSGAIVVPL